MDPAAQQRRLATMLTHALHTAMGLALVAAVVLAWRDGHHLWATGGLAVACGLAYVFSRRRPVLVMLLALWAVAAYVSPGFVWVALPLAFLVIHAFGSRLAFALVAVMAAWCVWITGSVVGPLLGAATVVLATAIFVQQRRDAEAQRELVRQLRETQAELAGSERERGALAERERLSRDIHDTIAQGLASIVMLARTDGSRELIESTARENLAEARRLVRDLGPAGEIGLPDALESLAADLRARSAAEGHGIGVEVVTDGTPRPLPPDAAAALRRGVQASLANVLRHSEARTCRVAVTWFNDQVVVDVVDDGVGFDPDRIGPDSFGIRGVRARMEEVGGSVGVESEPGRGTVVGLAVPIPGRQA